MIRLALALGLALAGPAPAQEVHVHDGPAEADPHAGHHMAMPADPHAGHVTPQPTAAGVPTAEASAPPPPSDHAADRDYDPAAMAAARKLLRQEHGAVVYGVTMARLAEYQAGDGHDGYRWDVQASYGGDIHRVLLKSEGEGGDEGVEAAELQALYSRAISPYADIHVGVRQDFQPRDRTYLTLGTEALAPYWIDVEGALFLSTTGEALARAEATYDLRLTQRLILQPRAELNFAFQDTRATQTGTGLSTAELGLRLRYELRREFAPYVGVSYERRFGATADYAREAGRDVRATRFVAGVRAWF